MFIYDFIRDFPAYKSFKTKLVVLSFSFTEHKNCLYIILSEMDVTKIVNNESTTSV